MSPLAAAGRVSVWMPRCRRSESVFLSYLRNCEPFMGPRRSPWEAGSNTDFPFAEERAGLQSSDVEGLCFIKGWHNGAIAFLRRMMKKKRKEKGRGWGKENFSGKEACACVEWCCVSLRVKRPHWQVVAFVFVSCSVCPPYHLPTPSAVYNPKTGNPRLLLPSDPPPLSTALSPAPGWAPSASGADTGHLSSPATDAATKTHITPRRGNTYVAFWASPPPTFNSRCKNMWKFFE